jgi:hypothetical protein
MTDQQHEDVPKFANVDEARLSLRLAWTLAYGGNEDPSLRDEESWCGAIEAAIRASERARLAEDNRASVASFRQLWHDAAQRAEAAEAEVARLTAEREASADLACSLCGGDGLIPIMPASPTYPTTFALCHACEGSGREAPAVTVDSDDELGKWRQELYWTL